MATAICPECDRNVKAKLRKLGMFVTCKHCKTKLVVVSLNPLELDWPFEGDYDMPYRDHRQSSQTH